VKADDVPISDTVSTSVDVTRDDTVIVSVGMAEIETVRDAAGDSETKDVDVDEKLPVSVIERVPVRDESIDRVREAVAVTDNLLETVSVACIERVAVFSLVNEANALTELARVALELAVLVILDPEARDETEFVGELAVESDATVDEEGLKLGDTDEDVVEELESVSDENKDEVLIAVRDVVIRDDRVREFAPETEAD
jgi:hypothetical protein